MAFKDKEKYNAYIRHWKKNKRKRDPNYGRKYQPSYDQKRNSYMKRTFGITLEEYNQLVQKQSNVCAICKCSEKLLDAKGIVRNLSVDHDHETNQRRELLCSLCNTALGGFKDSILVLESALEYLKKYKGL